MKDHKLRSRILLFIFLFIAKTSAGWADTVYTQDERAWKGLIVSENAAAVGVDLGFDVANIKRDQIVRIVRSTPKETAIILKELEIKRARRDQSLHKRDGAPKEAVLINRDGHVFVDVVLNGRVKARLFMDTGSTVTFITQNIARELNLSTKTAQSVEAMTSDGRKQQMPLLFLDSMRVGTAEAQHVAVAVLPKQSDQMPYMDGLLGMSFLSHFNFKIDYERNKLILEKNHEESALKYGLVR